ncbi:MAG: M10 family metallopeptidase C-terminal domain-containing protein [Paracoccaceae bacterium]
MLGGRGDDTLNFGAGSDVFIFNTAPNAATNVDTITFFSVVGDTIHLTRAAFDGLAAASARTGR